MNIPYAVFGEMPSKIGIVKKNIPTTEDLIFEGIPSIKRIVSPVIRAVSNILPYAREPFPKSRVLSNILPYALEPAPKKRTVITKLPYALEPVPKSRAVITKLPYAREPVPKSKAVKTKLPYAREPAPKKRTVITKLPYALEPVPKIRVMAKKLPTPPIERSSQSTVQTGANPNAYVALPKKSTVISIQPASTTAVTEITGQTSVKNIPAYQVEPEPVNFSPTENISGVLENLNAEYFPSTDDTFAQDWGWGWTEPVEDLVQKGTEAAKGIDPKILIMGAFGTLVIMIMLMRK